MVFYAYRFIGTCDGGIESILANGRYPIETPDRLEICVAYRHWR
jgi:hypothetical protein